jgi:chitin synthase
VITMKKWSEYEIDRRTRLAQAQDLPTPIFAQHSPGVEVFRDNEYNSRYSYLSNESGNVPLTRTEYGLDNYQARGESSAPLGVIPDTITRGHNGFEIDEIMKTSDDQPKDEESETHELGWIQQSTHDNNWADPAPHHNHAKKDEEDDNRSITSL